MGGSDTAAPALAWATFSQMGQKLKLVGGPAVGLLQHEPRQQAATQHTRALLHSTRRTERALRAARGPPARYAGASALEPLLERGLGGRLSQKGTLSGRKELHLVTHNPLAYHSTGAYIFLGAPPALICTSTSPSPLFQQTDAVGSRRQHVRTRTQRPALQQRPGSCTPRLPSVHPAAATAGGQRGDGVQLRACPRGQVGRCGGCLHLELQHLSFQHHLACLAQARRRRPRQRVSARKGERRGRPFAR